jgi:hypothetical protein
MDGTYGHYAPRHLLRFPQPLRIWLSSDYSIWPLFNHEGFYPGVLQWMIQSQAVFGVPSARKKLVQEYQSIMTGCSSARPT